MQFLKKINSCLLRGQLFFHGQFTRSWWILRVNYGMITGLKGGGLPVRAVVTRVKSASVVIEDKVNGAIGQGFLVLLGVGPEDTAEVARKLAEKIYHVRVFSDEAGKMNRSIEQVGGSMLVISQFTLYADLKKRRPGFSHAAPPMLANELYEVFMQALRDLGVTVEHGEFGADMQVESVNDGPVTLCFDTEAL